MYDLIFNQKGKDNFYKTWHTPEKNIFLFIQSGDGSVVIREKSYPIAKGVLCFIGKNKYHYTAPKNNEEYVRSKLFLDSVGLEKIVQTLSYFCDFAERFSEETIIFSVLTNEEYERVLKIFDDLNRLSAHSKYMQAEICSAAIQLMLIIAKNFTNEVQKELDLFQLIINYINSHISEEITIELISEKCYISKYYLCRMFKKKMGLTVMEYILQTRIVMAKELLKEGNLSVTEISIICGFSSPAYFSRIFKEKTGVTPSKYRRI